MINHYDGKHYNSLIIKRQITTNFEQFANGFRGPTYFLLLIGLHLKILIGLNKEGSFKLEV